MTLMTIQVLNLLELQMCISSEMVDKCLQAKSLLDYVQIPKCTPVHTLDIPF